MSIQTDQYEPGEVADLRRVSPQASEATPSSPPFPGDFVALLGVPGMGTGLEVRVLYGASW